MMIICIKIIASLVIGLLAGLSAVYVFNHIPYKWLCDYGETPVERGNVVSACKGRRTGVRYGDRLPDMGTDKEAENITRSLVDPEFRRIKENPWRWVCAAGFICLCLRLSLAEYQGGFLAVSPDFVIYSSQMAASGLIACWLMLIIALADMKYMIIPDQFVIMLALTGIGFARITGFKEALIGLAIGGGFMLLCSIIGKLIFKQEAFGFGDVKLCAAIGLVLGINGTIAAVAAAVIISGFVSAAGLAAKKYRRTDARPLGPYLCGCAMAYIFIAMPLVTGM